MWWSGWLYAYRTFWLEAGAHWDQEKTVEFLGMLQSQTSHAVGDGQARASQLADAVLPQASTAPGPA